MALKLIGALILTYLVSRLTLRLHLSERRLNALVLAHALALALLALLLMALRVPQAVFRLGQLAPYAPAQFLWLCLDGVRRVRPRGVLIPDQGINNQPN